MTTVDADGDGLLAQSSGGLDPDDAQWDMDADGLSDAYELTISGLAGDQGGQELDPRAYDTDNDTIPDGQELYWGTDPANQDTDDDGIVDAEELLPNGGWEFPYAADKLTRVVSNPLLADSDNDGLTDLFERSQVTCPTCTPWADPNNPAVFNPNVWNISPVALFNADSTIDGYVLPGATVVYTSTTANNLSGGQLLTGKLSVDAPPGFSATNTEATITVNSGETESLITILTVNATTSMTGAVASTMQLTDFASTVWSWDAPLTASTAGSLSLPAVDALAVTGWSEPILMATHDIAADGTQGIVASVANVAGEVRQSLTLTERAATTGLTRPDIACTDDGDCLVVWGQNDADQTGSVWISLLSGRLPGAAATRQMWNAASTTIQAPTVATSNGDYMLTWATEAGGTATLWSLPLDGTGGFKYTDQQPPALVEPTAFHTAASAAVSSPQSNWSGSNYSAIWAENGSLLRAQINAATGADGAATTISAGQGWPQSTGLSRPPAAVIDPVSLQSLLIYRSADNHLYAGRLNAAGAFAPLALDTGSNFNMANVQTALCADPINGGWVAAWARPGATTVDYQAVGPDGTLRGTRQTIDQSDTAGLDLACSVARPIVDLEFEEARGATTFADSSGFGNDAACSAGACPVASVEGRFGRGVQFNGVNQNLAIPNNADFNFAVDEDFTISFWVNAEATQLDTSAADNSIVEKWSNAGGGYPFVVRYLHGTGQIYGERYDGAHTPTVTSVQAINDGQFHHVAFVKNGADLSLYIDGVQSGASVPDTTTETATETTTNAYPIYLGMRGGGTNHFTGTLDRLQIYPRALTLQEIGGIFDAASAIYDLDEVAGSQTFVDGSGNELTATCQGAACPVMGAAGVAYTAAAFDGVDDMITVAPIKRVVTSYSYDFEAGVGQGWNTTARECFPDPDGYWSGGGSCYIGQFGNERITLNLTELPPHDTIKVRFNLLTQYGSLNNYWDGNRTDYGPDRWEWGYDSTPVLNTTFADCPDKTNPDCWGYSQAYPYPYSSAAAQPGFTMSARSTGAPVNFWQDVPNLVSTQVGDNPEYADTLSLWSCQVRVFEDDNYGGSSVMFDPFAGDPSLNQTWPDGVVDLGVSSLRIWPLQHRPHAGYTASYYTGIIPFDGQVYTLEGTISGHTADSITVYFEGQTSTTDPGGPELWSLDNVQVTLEQDETSIPLTDQSFTVSAWAKQVEPGQPGAILSQGIHNTNQGLHFAVRDSSAFTCAFYGDDLNTSDATLIDAEWHHWVCTYDAVSKTRTLYRDGIQVAQDQASANYQGLGETYIGSALGTDWFFNGEIDEVATWREALTADDVVDLYNKVKVQDQSVMVGTIFAATGTASFNHSEVTLRETATDVGDIAQTTNRTLTVDADAPHICQNGSQCPIADQYVRNTGTLVVAGTAEDPTSYISAVDVNDGGWQPATGTATWSYGWNISALGDGEHTLPVRATDAVGHVSSIYNLGVVIDSTPPQATFATGDGAVQRPTRDDTGHWRVSLAGNVTDPLAGSKAGSGVAQVDVLLDGAGALAGQGWQPATIDGTGWTIDYVLPGFDATSNVQTDPTGSYTVTLRATDAISNTTPAGAYPTTQSRLDAAGPTIVATAPLSNTQLITTALTILGTVEDASAIAGVEVNFTPAEQIEALNGALVYHAFDEDQASQYFDNQSGSNNAAVCDLVACPEIGVAGQTRSRSSP